MPQPIEEGMVLGGRYLVTGHVLTSADQDMVLDGRDQVLNRDVSILVASPAHASQVAASARELATGERHGSIQVLDLGLSEGRTYLIAGGAPRADELLDMVREQQVYVEPFHTDTLGSEIFGEARTYEPHVYEDDEEYYEELDDGFVEEDAQRRRPRFLKNISERLSQRLGSDAARDAVAGAAGAGTAGAAAGAGRSGEDDADDAHPSAARRQPEQPLPDTVSDDEWTGVQDEVTLGPQDRGAARPGGPSAAQPDSRPDTRTAAQPVAQAKDRGADRPAGTGSRAAAGAQDDVPSRDEDATQAVAATPAGGAVRDDRGSGRGGARPGDERARAVSGRKDLRGSAGEDTGEVPRPGAGDATGVRGAAGPAGPAPSRSPKVSLWSDDEDDRHTHGPAAPAAAAGGAALAGAAAAASAGRSGHGRQGGRGGHPETSHAGSTERHAGAPSGSGTLTEESVDEAYREDEYREERFREDERPRGARWILGGILVLLLVLGAVFAFNLLGNNREPVADGQDSSTPAGGSAESASPSASESPASDLPEPVIADATRLVPDDPGLSAETDTTLPNAIDGNPATAWQTYSFAQPAFGGYASSMALVVELEEDSAVNQVDITQNSGTGGSFTVLLNDSPDLEGAQQIAEGSFTGPQVSVPVNGEDGGPASARYVILNFTELPRLSNASGNLPYGLRIAEVEVQ